MANLARQQALTGLTTLAGNDLAERLLAEYDEILKRFAAGDHRPTELSGGRFAEAGFRICQAACSLPVTPLGRQLPRSDQLCSQLENVPAAQANESFRIHVPRALRTIYDFRNKRDVAHLGAEVSPNFPDSSLVIAISGWVLAEFVRLTFNCPPAQAQLIVDSLADRRIPLVWQQGDIIRVLDPALGYRERTLAVLYHLDPVHPSDKQLFDAVEYSSLGKFRDNILEPLHDQALIHYRNGTISFHPASALLKGRYFLARTEVHALTRKNCQKNFRRSRRTGDYFVGRLPGAALADSLTPGYYLSPRWSKSVWLRAKTRHLRFADSGGRRPGTREMR